VSAIEATDAYVVDCGESKRRRAPTRRLALLIFGGAVVAALALPHGAVAGHAATGKPAFQPCTQCHPVFLNAQGQPSKPLPIGMKKHEIKLEIHDVLGADDRACLACHDDPTRNPGKLILPDGSLVDITGDVSRVCQRCHFEKFEQWKAGVHGKGQPKCSAAGCHDPHTPSWIYVAALPPFQGTGIEVNAVGADRESFRPLAGPPLAPAVETPGWLVGVTGAGLLVSLGAVGFIVSRRSK
jgi:hypothetical protein